MKKIFIKHNPYKLQTEITVDGKKLAQNSKLGEKSEDGNHLQEWVEEFPQILVEEYNDKEFEIVFLGTLLDYEDLKNIFKEAQDRGEIIVKNIEHIHAKETSDKEILIDEVFNEIQKGPFDELRDEQIVGAFNHAKSSDFEVCVVATMSSGKSTLINAMLGTKLMPSKQEACTAIITRIKDVENQTFKAEVFDKENDLTETHENITLPIMERLNSDEITSEIKISGDIPFVSSDEISLVLIDTPGPNNSRDPRHKKVQSELLGKSSKALVLYIMTGEFGTDDDSALLKRVAESMAVGGKQSKDRFIFVVNKLDDWRKEDGDVNQTLERVRAYLKTHGVLNPNLFPAAALPALNLRMMMSGAINAINDEEEKEEIIDETELKVKKLNRNETLHFENYAALPASIRGEINGKLDEAKASYTGRDNENQSEALIHTGVVSIEAAIRQYVQKYAKTAKVKNIVDTFTHKLDELGTFEETKRNLAKNQDISKKIGNQIASIQKKIDSAENAKKFKDAVDDATVKVNDDSKEVAEEIIQEFQSEITKRFDAFRGKDIPLETVGDEVEELQKFVEKLEPDFEVELNEVIRNNLENTNNALLEEYKEKLKALTEEIDGGNIVGVTIDPLKLMGGSVVYDDFSIKKYVKEKDVEDGEEYVKNENKKWYKPWTWLQDKYYYRTKYKKVKYVSGSDLADEFMNPVERNLHDNGDSAVKYARKQSKRIAERFNKEFKRLDDVLKAKLDELESYATDKDKAEERVKESESRLKWLENIKTKMEAILEI